MVEVSFALQAGRGRNFFELPARSRSAPEVPLSEDEFLEACLEGGAETYDLIDTEDGKAAEVFTEVENLEALSQTLRNKHYAITQVELRWIPQNTLEVSDPEQARSLLKLMNALEDLDDVQSATANFEMADDLIALSIV
jgi:transcriptional/translational regulatory protein YebC/TACO1